MSSLIIVQVYGNRVEVEYAKEILGSNGIESIITADDCGGMRPWLAAGTGGVKLSVKEEDVVKAKEVLQIV